MKNIITQSIRIVSMIAIAAAVTGCGDWLDVKPYDKDLETTIFSNEDQIQAAHNGLYLQLAEENLYGMHMGAGTVDLLGQQYAWYSNSGVDLANEKYVMLNYEFSEDVAKRRFASMWSAMYNVVLNVNKFIDRLSTTENIVSQEHKDMMLGEAYAMRAFLHFDLLRLFGPIYKSNADDPAIPYYTSSKIAKKEILSAKAVAGKVLADIEIALSMLEDDPILRSGVNANDSQGVNYYTSYRNNRLNYYAVCLLKARVLHYMGNDAKTEEFVRSILSGVDNTFEWTTVGEVDHARHPDRIFYSEVVFGIHDENMYNNWKDYFSGDIMDINQVYLKTKKDLAYAFGSSDDNSDFRGRQWNTFIDPLNAYCFSTKFRQPAEAWNGSYFRPLMRKTELYYILAECSGNTSWLTTVKEKHVSASMIIPSLDEGLTREYMLEMFGEGQLFFFYKRRAAAQIRKGSSIKAEEEYITMPYVNYMPPIPESETKN